MTALGLYLLVSLLFVMATMVEFAGVIFLKRKLDFSRDIRTDRTQSLERSGSFEIEKLSAKIDAIALLSFFVCYILFNGFYWAYYLTTN